MDDRIAQHVRILARIAYNVRMLGPIDPARSRHNWHSTVLSECAEYLFHFAH